MYKNCSNCRIWRHFHLQPPYRIPSTLNDASPYYMLSINIEQVLLNRDTLIMTWNFLIPSTRTKWHLLRKFIFLPYHSLWNSIQTFKIKWLYSVPAEVRCHSNNFWTAWAIVIKVGSRNSKNALYYGWVPMVPSGGSIWC